jgi:hypothetical protein
VTELDLKIIQLMKGASPPQTVRELLEACAPVAKATIFSKISGLLNAGEITRDDLPWRKDKDSRTKQGRPRDKKVKALEKQAESWAAEGGKDRVAAGKLLLEIRQSGAEVTGPPSPDDKEATVNALKRQLAAVGREWSMEAFNAVFPPLDVVDIVMDPIMTAVPAPGLDAANLRPGRVILVGGSGEAESSDVGGTAAS